MNVTDKVIFVTGGGGGIGAGTVQQELQAGYMIEDRLLRPTMVAVVRKGD